MAWSFTALGSGGAAGTLNDTANATTYTTESVSTTASRLLLAVVISRGITFVSDPTFGGTLSVTWERVITRKSGRYFGVFAALTGAGGSGTVTADFSAFGTPTGCSIHLIQVDGAHLTDGAAVAARQATIQGFTSVSSKSLSLHVAPSSANAIFAATDLNGTNEAIAPDGTFTELTDGGFASPSSRLETQWGTGITDPNVDSSWTTASGGDMLVIELWAPDAAALSTVAYASKVELDQTSITTPWTLTKPSGVTSGDLLLAFFLTDDPTKSVTSLPSGWAAATDPVATVTHYMAVFYKVAGGSEPASYDFGWNTSNDGAAAMLRYTGASSSPIDAFESTDDTDGDIDTITDDGLTTTQGQTLAISFAAIDAGVGGSLPMWLTSLGFTKRVDIEGTNQDVFIGLADRPLRSAGAISHAWTELTASQVGGTIIFSVKQAAAGGAGVSVLLLGGL